MAVQDHNPIRIKLDKALARYDVEFENYSIAVVASFEIRAEAAKRVGQLQLAEHGSLL